MPPNPPQPHDAIAQRAHDQLWAILLREPPAEPPPPDPDADEQPDEDGASAEAAA